MSSLVTEKSKFHLTADRLQQVLSDLKLALRGRVKAAYIFGSAAEGTISPESDIDLILVCGSITEKFVERPLAFADLFQIYPKLDILVYTQAELDQQLADSATGFWKSVRLSMRKLI